MVTFVKSFKNADHTRRMVVTRTPDYGWDVREELDASVVTQAHYADWHRVERARRRFEWSVPAAAGWSEERTAEAR